MSATDLMLLGLALFGHLALWVAVSNRLLALGWIRGLPRRLVVALPVLMLAIPWALWPDTDGGLPFAGEGSLRLQPASAGTAYVTLCWVAFFVQLAFASHRRLMRSAPAVLRSSVGRHVNLAHEIGRLPIGPGLREKLLARLPRNEIFRLELNDKQIELHRLPRELGGLSIVHLSDLHFSGAIGKEFFQEVVRLTNEMQPDLIALTGDIVDRPECVDWIADVLGRLESTFGAYFVLGNHDLRVDVRRLRQALGGAGLIDLGGRPREISIRGQRVLLAGNELPWFRPQAELNLATADETQDPSLRLLLAHTPDQYAWARRHGFDLMLAGHTHGGQIRLPVLGAWVCPSLHGVRYASGVFHEPPTVLHVSRGVSSLQPLRLGCPPELTRIVLHAAVEQFSPSSSRQGQPLAAAGQS